MVKNYLAYCLILCLGGCHFGTVKEGTGRQDTTRHTPALTPATEQPDKESDDLHIYPEMVEQQALPDAQQYDDLWRKLRHRLSLDRQTGRHRVQKKIDWYRRYPDYLQRVAERANLYFYYIINRLEERDMPLELALLPIVESAFQPFAYSPRGASGLWQFMPATGRRFDLKQSWWYDGRRDVITATEAALDYLQLLHQTFAYDWYHALAAYNAGEQSVARAIKRNQRGGRPIDFWSLRLSQETRNYVPSLLALAEIVADPANYGLHLKPIPNQPYFAKVDVGGQIDLAVAAGLADISTEKIHMLNPGFNRWATDPDGPHHLLVPFASTDLFKQRLAALPDEQRMQWQQHKIKKGETLSVIAHRYRLRSNLLRQVNRLQGDLIRAGDILLVPASSGSWVRGKIKENRKKIYTVRRSDSLWKIGKRHGVSVKQLITWNTIRDRNLLLPGQKLVIHTRGDEQYLGSTASIADDAIYIVKAGDSLWQIARRLNVGVADLRRWNRLPEKQYLQPGQRLTVTAQGVSECRDLDSQHCY